METFIQCGSAFVGCLGFSLIFRVHKHLRFAIVGSVIGTIGWLIYLMCNPLNNAVIQSFIAMIGVSFMAEIMARVYKAPATIFIMIGFFPLVPGSGIYYTMLYAVQGQQALFADSLLTTLGIGIAIALAILIMSTVFQVYRRIKNKDYLEAQ